MTIWCKKCGETRARYKERGRGKPLLYCGKCKKAGMMKVKGVICEEEECPTTACYNIEGEPKGRFCNKHKEPGMLNVKDKRCEYPGCKVIPVFNYKGNKKGRFCVEHKLPDMISVKRKCERKGCGVSPAFNFEGETIGRFCATHKLPKMINVVSRRCNFPGGCKRQPCFNFEGISLGIRCSLHREENMIDVKTKKCAYSGCRKLPNFNFRGKKAKFCGDHKKPNMINVKNKKCEEPGCNKTPCFNFEGEIGGRFCSGHKLPKMVDVKSDTCEMCYKRASFNTKGESWGRFCATHKEIGMVTVKHKICDHKGCKTHVCYGILFSSPTKCAKHRNANMIFKRYLYPKCQHSFDELCPNRPLYAPPDITCPTHCEDHAPHNYINIVEKNCEGCGDPYYMPDNRKKCEICRDDKIQKKIEKARELRVKSVLETHKIPLKSYDQIPEGSCSQKRPDFVIDHAYFPIIIEVDEKQHKSYPGVCDMTRMIQLHQDFGENIIFIRYNPDSYINRTGTLQKGFQQNPRREKRLISLVQQLLLLEALDYSLSAYYLFYNGDDGVDRVIDIDYDNYYSDYRPLVKKIENERKGISEEIEE